jgi:beta-xylosidase
MNRRFFLSLNLCVMLSASFGSIPTAAEAPTTYTNPVWNKDFPDPFVLRHKGKFYAYATETGGHKGFQVMESPDLVNWTHKGTAFRPAWSDVHYWAPEVLEHRGTLYMTYSALNPKTNKHDIGIATSKNPLGQFVDKGILLRGDDNKVGVIDATLFIDSDKTPYIIYSEEEPRRIVLRRMAKDLLSVTGERIVLLKPDRDWERGVTEAPTVIKRGGKYHLFYSVGWFQSNKQDACYAVCHAVAPSLTGTYVKDAEPLVKTVPGSVYGPGHQSLITLPNGEMWMPYHAWDDQNEPRYGSNPIGRTMRIDRLKWNGDTPVMDGATITAQPAPSVKSRR